MTSKSSNLIQDENSLLLALSKLLIITEVWQNDGMTPVEINSSLKEKLSVENLSIDEKGLFKGPVFFKKFKELTGDNDYDYLEAILRPGESRASYIVNSKTREEVKKVLRSDIPEVLTLLGQTQNYLKDIQKKLEQ